MSQADDARDAAEVNRLLAGAARTIANVRYCWLVTAAETCGTRARPMGRVLRDPDEDEWKIRFVTDGRSHKACDIRRDGKVTIVFQHDPEDAYVTLIGRASLRESASEVRRRWKRAYNAYFPGEQDRTNAVFVEVEVERMELWIRGVTPEPFGLQTTVLERDAGGAWRSVPDDHGFPSTTFE
jgi:general stress protein 26